MTNTEGAVTGELIELAAVQPSAEEQRADARGRIGNTALQSTIPTALVSIGSWLLALSDVDLDPGAGTDMPAVIASAFTTILTVVLAWFMNRKALGAVHAELVELRGFAQQLRELDDVA